MTTSNTAEVGNTAVHVTEAKPFAGHGGGLGTSGLQTLVHKQGHEGTITIDPLTGSILTPTDERPEWAEEFSLAQVAQRMRFYAEAVGPDAIDNAFKLPEMMAAEDLDWLCVRELGTDAAGNTLYITNEDGSQDPFEAWEQPADEEFRSEMVAVLSGLKTLEESDIDPAMYDFTGLHAVDLAIVRDNQRSAEEIAAHEQSQKSGFKAVNE